ncbi:MAG: histidine kinase [Actinomycetota bacterium]
MRRAVAVGGPIGASALAVVATALGADPRQLMWLPFIVACTGVGSLLWYRRAGGMLAGLFLFTGVSTALNGVLQAYADAGMTHRLPGAAWTAWAFQMSIAFTVVFFLIVQLFPTGRPVTPRWRWLVWATCAGGALMALVPALGVSPEFQMNFPRLTHPLQLLSPALTRQLDNLTGMAVLGLFLASAASIVVRYRRSDPEQRLQVKWFAAASAVAAVGYVAAFAVIPQDPAPAFALLSTLIPVAAGIAIVKYRLYEIDLVISKTIVYGTLVVFTTLVYVVVAVLAGEALGVGSDSLPLSIAATAVVALAFQPLRERMQRLANRVVYGRRATPYEVLARFSERVGEAYATEDVLPRTARVLAEGVHAARAVVWLRLGDRFEPTAAWPPREQEGLPTVPAPEDGSIPPLPGDHVAPVHYRDELLGALAVEKPRDEPLVPEEVELLDDLASQAGLVLANVRMTADLEARLALIERRSAALRASRQRIVAAQDAERRRLERNIHDGAQQHLVALAVKLRLAKGLLAKDPERARTLLDELRGEVGEALDTLSALSLGIYPPLLEQQGIAPALAAQYTRSNLPVRLHTDGTGRYPIEIEAAVYFCALEALQNAAKYARATTIDVTLAEREGALSFEVRDDGAGFDVTLNSNGTGLAGMRDRLAVFGGDAEITSAPGRGTSVVGRVPLQVRVSR